MMASGWTCRGQADLHLDEKVIIENSVDQTPGEAFFGTGTIEKKGKVSLTKGRKYNICLKWSNFKPVNPEGKLLCVGECKIARFDTSRSSCRRIDRQRRLPNRSISICGPCDCCSAGGRCC